MKMIFFLLLLFCILPFALALIPPPPLPSNALFCNFDGIKKWQLRFRREGALRAASERN